jgi:8-oxo-dGTP pyrophosphatase MutT (NUDIX family)
MADGDIITCYTNEGRAVAVPRDRVRLRPGVYGMAFTADRGQILLIRDRRSNVWELPGGGFAPGEQAAEAMAREFREEVGLDIQVGPAIYFADSFYCPDPAGAEGWHSLKLFYLVHTEGALDPHYEEGQGGSALTYGAAWVPIDELENVDLLADHYDAVQRAVQWLEATEGPAAGDDDDDDD